MGERSLSSGLLPKLALLLDIDVNHLLQGAMLSERTIRLKPENQGFITSCKSELLEKLCILDRRCTPRTLGSGMIAFDMDDYGKCLDVASFVSTYQDNTGMLIGSLEEIAFRQGIPSEEDIIATADTVHYGEYMKKLVVNYKSVDMQR